MPIFSRALTLSVRFLENPLPNRDRKGASVPPLARRTSNGIAKPDPIRDSLEAYHQLFLPNHIHSTRHLVYSGEVWTPRAAQAGALVTKGDLLYAETQFSRGVPVGYAASNTGSEPESR
jgi:hypothetical protein